LRTTTQDNPVGSSQPLSLEMTSIYYFFNPPTPTFYTNQVNVNSEYKAKRMNFQTSNISLTANDGLLPGSTNDDGGETYCDVGYIDNEISPNDILSYE
jgi:hypothetical protein